MSEILPPDVERYLRRLYRPEIRAHACRASTPDGVMDWQAEARPALYRLLGLSAMEEDLAGFHPTVELDAPEDLGGYTRAAGRLLPEPDVTVPFWLLRPKSKPPFPLALLPHGHSARGYDTYVGIPNGHRTRESILANDSDVAVQAVERGYLAIAPATRGIGCNGVPDATGKFDGRLCHSSSRHAILAGRTCLAERVWDLARLMDWALAREDVTPADLLVLGNSGGGMATVYAAACDERVRMAVPSCCFSLFFRPDAILSHCECNTVPGLLRFGEFYDVAGLIAPRGLCVINGRDDPAHPVPFVREAVSGLARIYAAAGVADRFVHHFGEGGHRFYKDLFWPEVERLRSAP